MPLSQRQGKTDSRMDKVLGPPYGIFDLKLHGQVCGNGSRVNASRAVGVGCMNAFL